MKDKIKGIVAQLQSLLEEGEGESAEHEASELVEEESSEDGAQVTDMGDTFKDSVDAGPEGDKKKKSMGVISAMLSKKFKDKC